VIDQDGATPSTTSGFYVTPAITDHDARPHVEVEGRCRIEKHARLGLPAGARVAIVVGTHHDFVEGKAAQELPMECVYLFPGGRGPRDVGLVRDDHDEKATFVKSSACSDGSWQHFQLVQTCGRVWNPAAKE
jgi:hypothetical protein